MSLCLGRESSWLRCFSRMRLAEPCTCQNLQCGTTFGRERQLRAAEKLTRTLLWIAFPSTYAPGRFFLLARKLNTQVRNPQALLSFASTREPTPRSICIRIREIATTTKRVRTQLFHCAGPSPQRL